MKTDDDKRTLMQLAALILSLIVGAFLFVGPSGFVNKVTSWRATAYGSHWLVVQYSVDGGVINSWEVDGAIANEPNSDGIYFTTDGGVVHLSGHYVYVQNPSSETKGKLLVRRNQRVSE